MYEDDIATLLSADPAVWKMFGGVYALDEVPSNVKTPGYLVVNTDARGKPGSHWVLVFKSHRLYYFDSFGLPPLEPPLRKLPVEEYNATCVQSPSSVLCGLYCVFVAIRMCRGYTLQRCLSPFSRNVVSNDEILINLMKRELYKKVFFIYSIYTTL